MMIAIAYTWNH